MESSRIRPVVSGSSHFSTMCPRVVQVVARQNFPFLRPRGRALRGRTAWLIRSLARQTLGGPPPFGHWEPCCWEHGACKELRDPHVLLS